VPAVPAGPPVPAAPAAALPAVPLGDALPGLPLLPATLPVPHDLVCEGTAWSAGQSPDESGVPTASTRQDRRDEW
ncbi:hypothetical protein H7I57_16715, partial [Mycobacterium pyrenivorans]|nr:hypothetical protein [Mycolicibacterium pyrenivorans]